MSHFELLSIHRILMNKPLSARALLKKRGSAAAVLDELTQGYLSPDLQRAVEADLHWLEASGHHLLTPADLPQQLQALHDPPFLLFAEGDLGKLSDECLRVSIVGARKASAYGRHQATSLAEVLSDNGICIVSGLALGIDAAAHEGALRAIGSTIAVLGTGCETIYPRRNWRLAQRIAAEGLIVSEYPTGTRAFPGNFPRRNRIVAGLTSATIVVEAALRSGSLISARLAAAEGREVMAVPGLVSNPRAAGCHALIREGATLIESADDVLNELGLGTTQGVSLRGMQIDLKPELRELLSCLAEGPMTIDEIMTEIPGSIDELTVNLVSLEVQGLIASEAGRYHATSSRQTDTPA